MPLSVSGVAQAQALSQVLAPVHFDRAVCSGYPRTRQTLDQLLSGRALAVEERAALREIRAGRLREIPRECLHREVAQAYQLADRPEATFLRGESWLAFQQRVLGSFQQLLEEPDWNALLLVSHDAVNRILLAWACGAGLGALAAFEQAPACLNIVDIDMAGPQVLRAYIRTLNYSAYDPGKTTIDQTVMAQVHASIDPRRLHA
ncbi:histidine phosphatase family protein [Pseudomonas sp. HS6-2]|uniref:histidine phosphatase family protein n=1 Tax=Pseudomonas sp. HS6-2 TaxID=3410986 RepID=UPI003BD7C205